MEIAEWTFWPTQTLAAFLLRTQALLESVESKEPETGLRAGQGLETGHIAEAPQVLVIITQ